jgi:hypothetical protein
VLPQNDCPAYARAPRTIARMPARIASGSVGQALMRVARAGSMRLFCEGIAADFAPHGAGFVESSREVRWGSIPIHSRFLPQDSCHSAALNGIETSMWPAASQERGISDATT